MPRYREAERAAKEEEFHETYVKDFLSNALNQDIELRIRLAEYFSFVSADNFKPGWTNYHDDLLKHRDDIRAKIDVLEDDWQQEKKHSEPVDQIERNLRWLYNEVGYVERHRSVTIDPRDVDIYSRRRLNLLAIGIANYR